MEPLPISAADLILSDEEIKGILPGDVLNINIGILGHVDSGKTAISKVLSRVTSTASLDKNPQSQERGITLDLGFSAFFTRFPKNKPNPNNYKYIQYTLVDCPGHASLIKTIIGGASIIDMMFLVVDVVKGIQTQTAECLVIGELLIPKMIVILNKIDQIAQEERETVLGKKIEGFKKVFSKTKFGDVPIVPISATGGEKGSPINVEKLIETIADNISIPKRQEHGPFFFLIDHCFPIKGQGSVVTGTVIQGSAKIGDEISFPQINDSKKIKSLQVFKKPVTSIKQGDRAGMLFTQLEAKQIERGIACHAGLVKPYDVVLITIQKVPYFKQKILNKSKFHITSGHQTVMGTVKLFALRGVPGKTDDKFAKIANLHQGLEDINNLTPVKFSYEDEYTFEEELVIQQPAKSAPKGEEEMKKNEIESAGEMKVFFALLELETPLLCNLGAFVIGSKLDTDINANVCRIGFHGRVIDGFDPKDVGDLAKLRVFKSKTKKGVIDRIADPQTLIVKDLFRKEMDLNQFMGKPIRVTPNGPTGKIISSFGQSGKIKISLDSPLSIGKDDKQAIEEFIASHHIEMDFKKYYTYKPRIHKAGP